MIPTHKINHQITAPEVRVIDELEENLGVMSLTEALKLATSKGLDLVEINGTAVPPIVKVIAYDKFRYQQEKKEKKQRATQRANAGGSKQIQISVREQKNDLLMKVGRIAEFLGEGNTVEILMQVRGREKANMSFARGKMNEFLGMITVPYKPLGPIGPGGRGGLMVIIAKK
jgi:translation initiation factor IF-3